MVQIMELDDYCLKEGTSSEEMSNLRLQLLDNLQDLSELKVIYLI